MATTKIKNNIENNIADTLFIPLYMKYRETNNPKTAFTDDFSCEMVKKIDYDFEKYHKAILSSIGVAIRSKYFDEKTSDFISAHKDPVIVFVGCGLDARYLPIGKELTDKAVFYELDIPEVIELRKKLLPPSKNNIHLPASMFDKKWMNEIKNKHKEASFLFVIEGVTMYFEDNEIKNFFIELSKYFNNSKILFDIVSKWLSKNSHKHDTVKLTNSCFKFGCDNDKLMEKWDAKLKLESSMRYVDFKEFKNIGFVQHLFAKILPKYRNSSKLLCYSIN